MAVVEYKLYDVVEMRKEHPCSKRSKLFQIVRVGADIKIMCLGCGNVMMLTRDKFNQRVRKVISHNEEILRIIPSDQIKK